tara:strand:+ start:875 stop:1483 length:609 start_codon:yes stop_codon:yes gene_type:complete
MKKISAIFVLFLCVAAAGLLLLHQKQSAPSAAETRAVVSSDDEEAIAALSDAEKQNLSKKFKQFNTVVVGTLLLKRENYWEIHIEEVLKNHSESPLNLGDEIFIYREPFLSFHKDIESFMFLQQPYTDKKVLVFGRVAGKMDGREINDPALVAYTGYMITDLASSGMEHKSGYIIRNGTEPNREFGHSAEGELAYLRKLRKM